MSDLEPLEFREGPVAYRTYPADQGLALIVREHGR
jgi:hypothetical protein